MEGQLGPGGTDPSPSLSLWRLRTLTEKKVYPKMAEPKGAGTDGHTEAVEGSGECPVRPRGGNEAGTGLWLESCGSGHQPPGGSLKQDQLGWLKQAAEFLG